MENRKGRAKPGGLPASGIGGVLLQQRRGLLPVFGGRAAHQADKIAVKGGKILIAHPLGDPGDGQIRLAHQLSRRKDALVGDESADGLAGDAGKLPVKIGFRQCA